MATQFLEHFLFKIGFLAKKLRRESRVEMPRGKARQGGRGGEFDPPTRANSLGVQAFLYLSSATLSLGKEFFQPSKGSKEGMKKFFILQG